MGILDWLRKKKETPAEAAKRRISNLSAQRAVHAESADTIPSQEAPLPTLDPQAIQEAHVWGGNQLQMEEEARPTHAEVKQKIIDKMGTAKPPQRRKWKTLDQVQSTQSKDLEQLSFDEVGVESEVVVQSEKKES